MDKEMKYKFHETPPEFPYDMCDSGWTDEPEKYIKEINWVAKNRNLDVNKFRVDDETFGDPVLFYEGKYFGYLDNRFYLCFDIDDFSDWWEFYN